MRVVRKFLSEWILMFNVHELPFSWSEPRHNLSENNFLCLYLQRVEQGTIVWYSPESSECECCFHSSAIVKRFMPGCVTDRISYTPITTWPIRKAVRKIRGVHKYCIIALARSSANYGQSFQTRSHLAGLVNFPWGRIHLYCSNFPTFWSIFFKIKRAQIAGFLCRVWNRLINTYHLLLKKLISIMHLRWCWCI